MVVVFLGVFDMKRFLVSYRFNGGQWNVELPANDLDDARRRLGQLVFGQVDGEVVAKVPAAFGPFAALTAAVRNGLRFGR
jgi:hypothetical protein